MSWVAASAALMVATIGSSMTDETRVMALEVVDAGTHVEVQLLANPQHRQVVSYQIEMTGDSTTRHNGRTTIEPGAQRVLSTIRTSKSGEWCARVIVQEEGRDPYELSQGSCD
jgi:hypothetical protein